jgi:hypothetical protein
MKNAATIIWTETDAPTVWSLSETDCLDNSTILLGVFSTQEKAQAWMEDYQTERPSRQDGHYWGFTIEQETIDPILASKA